MSAGQLVSSEPSTETKAESGSMAGHDMSDGAVNVSPEKQQLVGIRTAVVELRPLVKKIRTVGIVTYDETDRKSTRLNSSHSAKSRMPSSA